jgi:beta-lactamase class A
LTDIRLHIHRYAHPGGVVGFAIKDLSTGKHIAVNGQMSFNPASVIKVPVMVEAFRQAELGKIDMDETMVMRQDNKLTGSGGLQFLPTGSTFTIHRLIFQMITDSDNTATNMLIKKLGAANINATMRELGLRNTVIKDATLLCKLPGCHNTSSPEDMLLLMDKMYRHELVSADVCDQMLGIMEAQHHRWGIPRHLPPTVKIANKPGSLDYVRNDVGIVYAGSHPYILSIFSKNLPSNRRGTLLVASISRSVFEKRTGQIIKARG